MRDVTPAELEGFDAIVHLAALSNDPLGDLDPGLTKDINGEGHCTSRVRRVRPACGASSSPRRARCTAHPAPTRRSTRLRRCRPLTPYAESKVRAEEGLVELAGPDFAPVSMRNATVFGVSPRLRLDIVLNNLAAWAHTTGRIRLLSDGTAWRPLVHVRDVAKAALALLEAPEDQIRGEAFNVGTDEQNYLVRELAEVLASVTGCEIEIAEGSAADSRSYRVDFSKLARAFPDLSARVERGARRTRARRCLPRGRAHVGGLRRQPLHPPAPARSRCSTTESSTTIFAGARRSPPERGSRRVVLDMRSTRKPMKVTFFGHFGSRELREREHAASRSSRACGIFPRGANSCCVCRNPGSCRRARRDRRGPDHDEGREDRDAMFRCSTRADGFVGVGAELRQYARAFRTIKGQRVHRSRDRVVNDASGLSSWGPYNLFKWALLRSSVAADCLRQRSPRRPPRSAHKRRHNSHRRAAALQADNQRSARVQQMLAVVQHHQHPPVADKPQQQVHRGATLLVGQAQRADHRDRHQIEDR